MDKKRYALLICLGSLSFSASAFAEDIGMDETTDLSAPEETASAPAASATTSSTQTTTTSTATEPSTNGAALETAGQVVWIKGTVKATYPEQQPRVLARGALIYEKDTLNSEKDSSGEISFTDNSILTLQSDTTFVIDQYHFDQNKPSHGQYFMNLLKGGFRTITGFVAKAKPENYQVKTPVATIGVRGTDFSANCRNATSLCAFSLIHGKGVTLRNGAGVFELTVEKPYATIDSPGAKAILSTRPPTDHRLLDITPPSSPPPSGVNPAPGKGGSGNCGIVIN